MISGTVVCPAAPMFIPGLADSLAAEQACLCGAVATAVMDLAGRSDQLLVLAPGAVAAWQGIAPQDPGPSPFGRAAGLTGWAPGLWVAAALVPDSTRYLQQVAVDDDGSVPDLTEARALLDGSPATGIIALADGSRCHGEDAPGRIDPRSEGYEEDLHAALTRGPGALTDWLAGHRQSGRELGSTAPAVLATLDALLDPAWTVGAGDAVSAEYFGAPYGVGYHLARWPAR